MFPRELTALIIAPKPMSSSLPVCNRELKFVLSMQYILLADLFKSALGSVIKWVSILWQRIAARIRCESDCCVAQGFRATVVVCHLNKSSSEFYIIIKESWDFLFFWDRNLVSRASLLLAD